mgnify:CR=1 FL=1
MGLTNFPYGVNAGDSSNDGGTPLQIRSVTVSATAAELNTLAGALGAKALTFDSSTAMVMAAGATAISGTVSFSSGLGGTPSYVIATSAVAGQGTNTPNWGQGWGVGGGGTITLECYARGGTAASVAGTVNWIAIGTTAA